MRALVIGSFVCIGFPACLFADSLTIAHGTEDRAKEAAALMFGAEQRFVVPDRAQFDAAQQTVRAAADGVEDFLAEQGEAYAQAWKSHLRWSLLERNLGPPETIDYRELATVRRWLYSNRRGLEYPQFAALRTSMDAYLDAAYAHTERDLQSEFVKRVAHARSAASELAADPANERAAALAKTLGWFDRTGQLGAETAKLRKLFYRPNIQIAVSSQLAERVTARIATTISQSIAVHDRSTSPPAGLLGRTHALRVSGVAETEGKIGLDFPVNEATALLRLVYEGTIHSRCRADAGPAALHLVTRGTARAIKEVSLESLQLETRPTQVIPQVQTKIVRIDADSSLVRMIAERRSGEPQAQAQLKSEARAKAVEMLEREMDERVDEALQSMRGRLQQAQQSVAGFADVLAPVVREGASPSYAGARTSPQGVEYFVESRRRDQGGAPLPYPADFVAGEIQVRVHVSALENLAETIMAGKTFTDDYFMNYAKILQAELPVPLMVHSRAKRWSIVAAPERPLQLEFPERDVFQFTLRTASMNYDGEELLVPATARVRYWLQANAWGEYALHRLGDVALETDLPTYARVVLQEKLAAFFAPLLDGGGVVLPSGGELGKLQQLVSAGVRAEGEWFAAGVNVPDALIDDVVASVAKPRGGTESTFPSPMPPQTPTQPQTSTQP